MTITVPIWFIVLMLTIYFLKQYQAFRTGLIELYCDIRRWRSKWRMARFKARRRT